MKYAWPYRMALWATHVRGQRLLPFSWRRRLWERVQEEESQRFISEDWPDNPLQPHDDLLPFAFCGGLTCFHVHLGYYPNWRCVRVQMRWPFVSVTRMDNR